MIIEERLFLFFLVLIRFLKKFILLVDLYVLYIIKVLIFVYIIVYRFFKKEIFLLLIKEFFKVEWEKFFVMNVLID